MIYNSTIYNSTINNSTIIDSTIKVNKFFVLNKKKKNSYNSRIYVRLWERATIAFVQPQDPEKSQTEWQDAVERNVRGTEEQWYR